jgi:hypothetical protein
MIRRLIILLLIAGCEKTLEPSNDVHPLFGEWEFLKAEDCVLDNIIDVSDDFTDLSLTFNDDNSLIVNECYSDDDCSLINAEWSGDANIINMIFDNGGDVESYNYIIDEDTLSYNQPPSTLCFILIKQ